MPRGDGTGPNGMGPMTGRGAGGGAGGGAGRGAGGGAGGGAGRGAGGGAGGGGRGKMGGRGAGPGGECVCPQCGEKAPHQPGIPCYEQKCPKCNTTMVRA